MQRRTTGIALIAIGIIGLLAFQLYGGFAWNRPPPAYGDGGPWNPGMMGQPQQTGSLTISFDEAVTLFQNYVTASGNEDLTLKEVMEFDNNFYAIVSEKSTGVAAFELLIWKQSPSYGIMWGRMGMGGYGTMTGVVVPEPGPNMMWNTKYGMMQGMVGAGRQTSASSQMTVSEQDAKSMAENYLSQNSPGAHVEGVTRFYGYYTADFEKDGKITGMLSVNGYTGQVWYHSWHGAFIQESEFD